MLPRPIFLLLELGLASCLEMVNFNVPEFAHYNKKVVLQCRHHLDYKDGSLHSVKWYKLEGTGEMTNFYSYVPTPRDPDRTVQAKHQQTKQTKHKGTGLKVLIRESNEHQVVLKKVKISSSGRYKCEVMSKKDSYYSGPPFNVVQAEGQMQIVALSEEAPVISGQGSNYAYGDDLDLNCTAEPSYPPTTLTWYINNQPATDDLVTTGLEKTADELYLSTSRLRMRVSAKKFHHDEMRVECRKDWQDPIKVDREEPGDLVLEMVKLPEALKQLQSQPAVLKVQVLSSQAGLHSSLLLPLLSLRLLL